MTLRKKLAASLEKLALRISDVSGPVSSLTAPVSYSLGRLGNVPQALLLGTTRGIMDTSNPDSVREIGEAYEEIAEADLDKKREKASKRSRGRKILDYLTGYDPRGQGEARFSAGGSEVLENLGRVWSRPGISLPGRLLGTVGSPAADLSSALTRSDHYNPWAHTVTSYSNEPAIQAHELGHAQDFAEKNHPLLYQLAYNLPFVNLYHEAKASQNAMPILRKALKKRLKAKTEAGGSRAVLDDQMLADSSTSRVNRILSGSYGSYIGAALANINGVPPALGRYLGIPGALIGQLVGHFGKPWGELNDDERKLLVRTAKQLEDAKDKREQEEVIKRFAASVRTAAPKERKVALALNRVAQRASH